MEKVQNKVLVFSVTQCMLYMTKQIRVFITVNGLTTNSQIIQLVSPQGPGTGDSVLDLRLFPPSRSPGHSSQNSERVKQLPPLKETTYCFKFIKWTF